MRDSDLRIEPLSPVIGAEIHGIDLSRPVSDTAIAAIRAALVEHLVVFFRDQAIDL
ncbi:MAG: TauD/TfdA family dioxygenase, partial [Hyphomicrobiaceae bacterium]|nr:TauD/TfdA family dioxygenase [Hyphomicrobiaceae bacterium]